MDNDRHWVGTWATAPAPSETGVGFNNHTLRMNPRVSIGGDTVRVRVSVMKCLRAVERRDRGPF